ncbi:hypothetical protein GCM10012275_57030 [Longimycelium tulufanense]|uniref:Uncharacterized protein n=1 Tax=Longimycelium tulufanense TaxID=907463 RepID=A0A8J3CJX6_9PSEU|nr:hypothetical protein [Longimycelium tulufanense]GGM78986.1 hypothetical protein GCM10012275_57030 [Longimycelium tulufanense]
MLRLPRLPRPSLSAGAALSVALGLVVGLAIGQRAWRDNSDQLEGLPPPSAGPSVADADGPPMDYPPVPRPGEPRRSPSTIGVTPTPGRSAATDEDTAARGSGHVDPVEHRTPQDRAGSRSPSGSAVPTAPSRPSTSKPAPSPSSSADPSASKKT